MSRIHIARNHASLGQFSPEEAAEGLKTGELLPSDLAWRDPMDEWKPLSTFTDLPEVEVSTLTPPTLHEEPAIPAHAPEPAWERRAALGLFRALFLTVQRVFSNPSEVFQRMPLTGGLASPLRFYVLLVTLTSWVTIAYALAALKVNPAPNVQPWAAALTPNESELMLQFILMPAINVLGAFFLAGIFHFALLLLGASTRPYEATFRAVCYTFASASVFQLIPLCGAFVYPVVSVVLLVIALRVIHGTDTLRATLGVIAPLLFCGGLYAVAIIAAVSSGLVK